MSRRRTARLFEAHPVFLPGHLCRSGKRGYLTREDAQRAISYLQRLRGDEADRVEQREYRCQYSSDVGMDHYHLTSDQQRDEEAS